MVVPTVATDRDYRGMTANANRVEPAPRRVRATLRGEYIFDTIRARYVWECPFYPRYYIPVDDIDVRFLVDEHHEQRRRQGAALRHGLRAGDRDVFGDLGDEKPSSPPTWNSSRGTAPPALLTMWASPGRGEGGPISCRATLIERS